MDTTKDIALLADAIVAAIVDQTGLLLLQQGIIAASRLKLEHGLTEEEGEQMVNDFALMPMHQDMIMRTKVRLLQSFPCMAEVMRANGELGTGTDDTDTEEPS